MLLGFHQKLCKRRRDCTTQYHLEFGEFSKWEGIFVFCCLLFFIFYFFKVYQRKLCASFFLFYFWNSCRKHSATFRLKFGPAQLAPSCVWVRPRLQAHSCVKFNVTLPPLPGSPLTVHPQLSPGLLAASSNSIKMQSRLYACPSSHVRTVIEFVANTR